MRHFLQPPSASIRPPPSPSIRLRQRASSSLLVAILLPRRPLPTSSPPSRPSSSSVAVVVHPRPSLRRSVPPFAPRLHSVHRSMGEFSDDDEDFGSFDLAGALASAREASPPSASAGGSAQRKGLRPADANVPSSPFGGEGAPAGKRPPPSSSSDGWGGSGKKARASPSGMGSGIGSPGGDGLGIDDDDDGDGDVPEAFQDAMTSSLKLHFGHEKFRPGQLPVLHSLMGRDGAGGKDACVFWATGAGKSLCYQLPPLHLHQVAVVISPLISLMEDQVSKLNGRGSEVATLLGSSQRDPTAESRALSVHFRLVYVTPERLTGGRGLLDRLASMHGGSGGRSGSGGGGSGRICLFAVDEAHCVSEWGEFTGTLFRGFLGADFRVDRDRMRISGLRTGFGRSGIGRGGDVGPRGGRTARGARAREGAHGRKRPSARGKENPTPARSARALGGFVRDRLRPSGDGVRLGLGFDSGAGVARAATRRAARFVGAPRRRCRWTVDGREVQRLVGPALVEREIYCACSLPLRMRPLELRSVHHRCDVWRLCACQCDWHPSGSTCVRSSGVGFPLRCVAFLEVNVQCTPEVVAPRLPMRLAPIWEQALGTKIEACGHDFRPSFLKIGSSLRDHPVLASIPILALTATAVPRVQQDIIKNLQMRPGATVAKRSFDRPNLKISIRRKPRNGPQGAFERMVKEMAKVVAKQGATSKGIIGAKSTIVYCSTKREVEDVAFKISQDLAHQLVQQHAIGGGNKSITFEAASGLASSLVKPYHAGLSFGARTDAHTDFLVGKVAVIVATVAFGMGIDKPDIRRVIHWGACKTVEEYYQQMGRAGRDGLPAECVMYADTNDFAKYKGDFYLGGLSGESRDATVRSMDALRDFAMGTDGCRRAALLDFFHETPSFGKYCGTCDLCLNRNNYAGDFERDFQWEGARVILFASLACPGQAMSTLEKIISGGTVEAFKYQVSIRNDPSKVTRKIKSIRDKMKKKKPSAYFKELVPSLVSSGHLRQATKQSSHKYSKPYTVYDLTPRGKAAATATDDPIVLPVPASVREQERLEEEKRQETFAALKDKGVDLQQIPQEELDAGDGEAITALKRWYSYVDSLESRGRADMVNKLDDLKNRIEAWRMDMAEKYRMAPASVMEEHLLVKIAYATASLRAGSRMNTEALVAAGVRSNGIDDLSAVLGEWASENQEEPDEANGDDGDSPMVFKSGEAVQPARPWRYAVYKPAKKTGKATWEVSYDQFVQGKHPQTIAMTQKSGRPIQVATVVGHILEALVQGRRVDLHRLSSAEMPPTKSQWQELVRCSVETGIDVKADPATSGPDGERFTMKDFLIPIMGNSFALKDFKERTPEESAKWNKWCCCLKWYLALSKVQVEPTFGKSTAVAGHRTPGPLDATNVAASSHRYGIASPIPTISGEAKNSYDMDNAAAHTTPKTRRATRPSASSSFGSTSSAPAPGTPARIRPRTTPAHSSASAPNSSGGRRDTSSHDASSCATRRFLSLPPSASATRSMDSFKEIAQSPSSPLPLASFLTVTIVFPSTRDIGNVMLPVANAPRNVSRTDFQLNVAISEGFGLLRSTVHPATSAKSYSHVDPGGIHDALHRTLTDASSRASHRTTVASYPSNRSAHSACRNWAHRSQAAADVSRRGPKSDAYDTAAVSGPSPRTAFRPLSPSTAERIRSQGTVVASPSPSASVAESTTTDRTTRTTSLP
ncbi:hypothetical protein ACHAWF_016059 [Thalassiosira exigua]